MLEWQVAPPRRTGLSGQIDQIVDPRNTDDPKVRTREIVDEQAQKRLKEAVEVMIDSYFCQNGPFGRINMGETELRRNKLRKIQIVLGGKVDWSATLNAVKEAIDKYPD
jgi:hypothetical protein